MCGFYAGIAVGAAGLALLATGFTAGMVIGVWGFVRGIRKGRFTRADICRLILDWRGPSGEQWTGKVSHPENHEG